jgi:hypothetical protein
MSNHTHNHLYIVEREETRYDIRKMTADQLEELEMLLQGDITAIRDQLAAATARRWETGEYASADWFRRARTAQKIKARQLEMVKRVRKERRSQERREKYGTFGNYFMDAARQMLPGDTFNLVMAHAARLQAAEVAGGES